MVLLGLHKRTAEESQQANSIAIGIVRTTAVPNVTMDDNNVALLAGDLNNIVVRFTG